MDKLDMWLQLFILTDRHGHNIYSHVLDDTLQSMWALSKIIISLFRKKSKHFDLSICIPAKYWLMPLYCKFYQELNFNSHTLVIKVVNLHCLIKGCFDGKARQNVSMLSTVESTAKYRSWRKIRLIGGVLLYICMITIFLLFSKEM